ncbi:MAG TPA: ABC transporter permease [Bifidobacterium sp.]|nr:ABC transporter permease [Bifidobacterium sp.]
MNARHAVKRSVKHSRGPGGTDRARAVSRAFMNDMLRSWLHGWKRFLSIAVICMLGVAVLTGIYAGCRDMFRAADRFYDAQGLHDIQVQSTYGLTDDDVKALRQVRGVQTVQPERSQSVTTKVDGTEKQVTMKEIGRGGLDRPHLQQGRMPKKAGEIAVTQKFLIDSKLSIGDHLTVTPEADSDSAGSAPRFPTKLTIVGQVLDPEDLTNPSGYSTSAFRSPTTADYVFFAPSAGVTGSVYAAISITVKGASGLDTFDDDYDTHVQKVIDRIDDTVRSERQQARRRQIVDDAQTKLDQAKQNAYAQLDASQSQIDAQRAATANMGTAASAYEVQLDAAQQRLDAQRESAEREFAKQQQSIDDIGTVRWYVQSRDGIGGYSALDSDVSSIESIGLAFPVVFLAVAVLMSLTTMTRMVEEERGLIGTYTGLGYGSIAIASRYLLFAALACLLGGGAGLLAGFLGIPAFLMLVLRNMYVIPDIRLEYDWVTGTAGVMLFVIGVLGATALACMGELRRTPAELMRPKAPKAGARVLLEHITPLWKRLGFLNKVTVRNIFRFKSRLIMTVGGVAGCTALIVCGLAINDSVNALGAKQYDGVYRYDMMVVSSDANADAMRQRVAKDGKTAATLDLRIESGEMQTDDGSETVQLMVVPEGHEQQLGKMIALRDATGSHNEVTMRGNDVIVSQSAAKALGVTAGGTISLTDGNMRHGKAKVTAVTRNLIGTDVYMGEQAYRNTFDKGGDERITANAMLAKLNGDADANIAYLNKLKRDATVVSATSCDDMQRKFTFDLMGAVVGLIVALAGSLVLVVLFTLANTNVSERVREMATLKVLGFYDREVHTYVNKEMLILTGMGIVVGLPLGRWVGGLLTTALNMPGIYFEVELHWRSYLIAAGVTLVFALIVQFLTNPVLDRIDPVSSLKSVE